MKVVVYGNFECECGFSMIFCSRYDGEGNKQPARVVCVNAECKHFDVKFALPQLELEPVT